MAESCQNDRLFLGFGNVLWKPHLRQHAKITGTTRHMHIHMEKAKWWAQTRFHTPLVLLKKITGVVGATPWTPISTMPPPGEAWRHGMQHIDAHGRIWQKWQTFCGFWQGAVASTLCANLFRYKTERIRPKRKLHKLHATYTHTHTTPLQKINEFYQNWKAPKCRG